ncbi:hypothetical protein ACH5RR_010415 [Cinchona calisaya]|uniref:RING-type domain-containing protein n=1 Tax=Cinchona calisaya TaxID=153742 RepID=A0ABD3AIW6_9GENT
MDAFREKGARMKPLVCVCYTEERNKVLMVGICGKPRLGAVQGNAFGIAFRTAADETGAEYFHELFESSWIVLDSVAVNSFMISFGPSKTKLLSGGHWNFMMSTQEYWTQPLRPQTRSNVELNAVPPSDSRDQVGPSTRSRAQGRETTRGVTTTSASSAFAGPRNNSSRNHGQTAVADVVSGTIHTIFAATAEERLSRSSQNSGKELRKASANQAFINCNLHINLESSSNSARDDVNCMVSRPPPPPKELTFTCPICMAPFVEEMSTKCGHIFCKACIKSAIAAKKKCPTCRRRITMKDIIRIYLPDASDCSRGDCSSPVRDEMRDLDTSNRNMELNASEVGLNARIRKVLLGVSNWFSRLQNLRTARH